MLSGLAAVKHPRLTAELHDQRLLVAITRWSAAGRSEEGECKLVHPVRSHGGASMPGAAAMMQGQLCKKARIQHRIHANGLGFESALWQGHQHHQTHTPVHSVTLLN